MFQEFLEFSLTFVGIHLEEEGCTLAALGEFLDHDVFPFSGWTGNRALRDSVVRLLVNEHCPTDVSFVLRSPQSSHLSASPVLDEKKKAPAERKHDVSGGLEVSTSTQQADNVSSRFDTSSEMISQKVLTLSEIISILDEEHKLWEETSLLSISRRLFVCPSHKLRESVLGVPIRTSTQRQTIDYVSENALYGCDKIILKNKLARKYKQHTLTSGLSRLCRDQVLAMYYFMDSRADELRCRYFPWYAIPLTELEKKELLTSRAESLILGESGLSPRSFTIQQLTYQRNIKAYQPLNHYFWRRRQADPKLLEYVFDLKATKHVVKSSPERKLLYEDAIHAIFTVHGLDSRQFNEFNRANRQRLRRMLRAAGLRIVVVTVYVRSRKREVSIVVPEEDFYRFAISSASALKRPKTEDDETLDDNEEKTEGVGVGTSIQAEVESLNESVKSPAQREQDSLGDDTSDGESDISENPSNDSVSENESDSFSKVNKVRQKKEHLEMNATRKRSELATRAFYMSPEWPYDLQFAKEAEKRPIALVAAYPHMVLYPSQRLRVRSLSAYMVNYVKRGTLETYYTLTGQNKSFTLVYAPKAKPPSSGISALDQDTTQDPRLPAGISQYAIDVVLDALQASSHKALSVRQLSDIIDITALQRRILPYLRSIHRVTTTGVTLKSRERVGIVMLAGVTLTDDEKRAVAEASKEASSAHYLVEEGEEHGRRFAPKPYGRRVKLDVLLPNIPATVDGVGKSEAHANLSNPSPRVVTMARKIMSIRNGYARNAFYRAGRLHLELWKQWHDGMQRDAKDISIQDTISYSMNAEEIYNNMSLSTFCIVIGFPVLDLTEVLAEYQSDDTRTPSSRISWLTPLRLLPPSLQEICREQGIQPLLYALSLLQTQGVIRSDEVLDCFVTKKLQDIMITLECHATDPVRRYTCVLYQTTRFTSSMTMAAILRFWLPIWNRSVKHTVIPHMTELYESEANPSMQSLIALNRRLRSNVYLLTESFYQSCGINRSLRCDIFSEHPRKDAMPQVSLEPLEHGYPKERARTRHGIIFRRDTSAVTLAKDIHDILTSSFPQKRLSSMLHLLKRLSRGHVLHSSVGLASPRDGVWTSLQRHNFGLNPYTNNGIMHLCILGEALHNVLRRFMPQTVSTSAMSLSSYSRNLHQCFQTVFSPEASLFQTPRMRDAPCAQSLVTPEQLALPPDTTPPPSELIESSDYKEVMMDSLRMILLSDAAHYSSSTARELVLAFPAKLVAHGRNQLQREPSFSQGCWRRSHRIPELALAARPFLFTPNLMRQAPRHCANTALIHGWVTSLHDAINNASASSIKCEFRSHLLDSSLTAPRFDVLVTSQPVMDVKEIVSLPPEDDVMATLRVPKLVWPAAAQALEQAAHSARTSRSKDNVKKRRKRRRERHTDVNTNMMDEDEDAGTQTDLASTRLSTNDASITTSASLYPARTLARCDEYDAALANRIPMDPEPTGEEIEAVKKNIALIRATKARPEGSICLFTGPSKGPTAYPLPYPSIFHHVDGAFHTFVWKLFLLSIYRCVLYLPGVLYTTLREQAMRSGLISRRALDAALQYLVDCGVLVRTSVVKAGSSCEDCYTTSTLPEGLWDVIDLN